MGADQGSRQRAETHASLSTSRWAENPAAGQPPVWGDSNKEPDTRSEEAGPNHAIEHSKREEPPVCRWLAGNGADYEDRRGPRGDAAAPSEHRRTAFLLHANPNDGSEYRRRDNQMALWEVPDP